MVRPPKIRHSKTHRDPVTIDLDPSEVKRESGTAESSGAAGAAGADADQKPATVEARPTKSAAFDSAKPDPKQPPDEAATAKKAVEATPAGVSTPTAGAKDAGAAKAEASKPSTAAFGVSSADTTNTAGSGAKPVFGRDASASASSSSSPSRTAPPPPRSTGGPSATSGDSDKAAPRRGGIALVAAGIVGGIVVLAGAGALQYAGVLPAPGSPVEPGEPAGLAELRAEVAALRNEVAAGGNAAQPDPAQAARLDEIASTVNRLQTDVAELRSAISQGEGGDAAGLQSLDQRIGDLEAAVASLGRDAGTGAGETLDLAPLTERVGAVESQLAEVSRAAQAASEATAGIPDRIASLDQRLSAIDTRVGELASRIEAQASNPRIALAIAAAGLKAAIDRGDPFMTELETYASIAPGAQEIADLRGLAASGVPTRAAISAEVNAAANRMIAAAAPVAEDAGFFGRLLDSMQSVIKVRPIGDIEGDGVDAIVARLEAAVRAGDYGRAISEYETLPEPARQAGAEFIARVKARQSADTLVERALADALRPQEG
jgi:hypothetical protein